MSQRHREKVTTLKKGDAAADRRVMVDQKVATSASKPDVLADGVATHNHRYIHAIIEFQDAGTGGDFELWGWYALAEKWVLLESYGTLLQATMARHVKVTESRGADRAFLKMEAPSGTLTNGVNAWLGGSTF